MYTAYIRDNRFKGKVFMIFTLRMLICVFLPTCFAATMSVVEQPNEAKGSIRGQIYDSGFGLAIPGAKVTVLLDERVQQHAISDQLGFYEIKELIGRQYTVAVVSLGFVETERKAQVKMGEHLLLDIPLRIGHLHDPIQTEVNGRVKLSDNTPANGATVILIRPFDQQISATTRADQRGQYTLRVDDPGQYVLYGFKSGFKVATTPIIVYPTLPRERRTVEIVLSPFKSR